MSVMNKSADRSYPINDDWLDNNRLDPDAYIDVGDILEYGRDQRVVSPYLQWLITKGFATDPNLEVSKINFMITGIRTDETGSDQNTAINCQYMNDTFHSVRHFVGKMVHPNRIRRIYAYGTTARRIWLEGYTY